MSYHIFVNPIQLEILRLSQTQDLSKLTLREIGKLVNVDHPQKVKHHLSQLEKKGLINLNSGKPIFGNMKKISKKCVQIINIPILGAADCGPARLLADENLEGYLKLSPSFLLKKHNIYALRAEGNSMNNASIGVEKYNIESGDYVIVDSEYRIPKENDYVVSIIDGAANIKKFKIDKNNGQIALVSESKENYDPILIHPNDVNDYLISGKVIQVIKKPKF